MVMWRTIKNTAVCQWLANHFSFMSLISNIYQTIYEHRCLYAASHRLFFAGLMSYTENTHASLTEIAFFGRFLNLFSLFYSTWEYRFSLLFLFFVFVFFFNKIVLSFFYLKSSIIVISYSLSHLNQFQYKRTLNQGKKTGANRIVSVRKCSIKNNKKILSEIWFFLCFFKAVVRRSQKEAIDHRT